MVTSLGLAFLAGILSVLSPCVLPLLPLVLGAAASEHRLGPAALAAGLALSFVVIGLFVATVGFAIGLDAGIFRTGAAIMLILIGLVLMVPAAQTRLAVAAGPVSNWTESRFGGFSTAGLLGQFGVGLLLGAVWSPCVGPTLGAASLLASQGRDLGIVALTMLLFGLGAALPLLLLGTLSREVLMRWRDRMMGLGKGLKAALGLILVVTGLIIVSGYDKTAGDRAGQRLAGLAHQPDHPALRPGTGPGPYERTRSVADEHRGWTYDGDDCRIPGVTASSCGPGGELLVCARRNLLFELGLEVRNAEDLDWIARVGPQILLGEVLVEGRRPFEFL